jgi:hypothetical protein
MRARIDALTRRACEPGRLTRGIGSAVPIVVAIALAACAVRAAAADDESRRYEIRGFVVDETDRPVAGATISLEGAEIAAQADSLGGFVLPDVPAGSYRLTARLGCVMSAHMDALHIPRPLRVPLPIRLFRIDCGTVPDLTADEQRDLVARGVEAFVSADRAEIVRVLLGDGAIRLLDGGNVSIDATAIGEASVPVAHLSPDDTFTEAIWISLCFTTPDEETVLLRLLRSSPPVPEELDVFAGDAALLTFTREAPGDPWHLARQLVCVDAEPIASEGSVSVEGEGAPSGEGESGTEP